LVVPTIVILASANKEININMPVAKYFCNRQVGTAYFPNLSYHFDQFKSVFMDWVRSITPIIASASF